ncbi:MAG: sulfatase-like hydrolase/transferase [Spirochaetales bacterium]
MRPQNVIWITTDHMRYDCIGAHGNPAMHTPHLDRLVNAAVSFDRCYANSPVCMPSRASFMTGCYPQQAGVVVNGQTLAPDFGPSSAHSRRVCRFAPEPTCFGMSKRRSNNAR